MMRLAELTNMKPNEKDDLINLVLLVGKKLVATWKHYRDYFTLEDQLIEQAKAGEVIDTQSVQQISYSQDLYLEMDEFLVQFKSTLDYVVKFPVPLVLNAVSQLFASCEAKFQEHLDARRLS
jgi:hypothetical protein